MFLQQVGNLLRPDKPIHNFINGDFVPSEDGQTTNDINPSTGDVVCAFPSSSKKDVENAVKAANAALFSWSTVPKRDRCQFLIRVADLLEKRSEDFCRAEMLDQGKTAQHAKNNTSDEYANEANMARLLAGQAMNTVEQSTCEGILSYSTRHPLGVVAVITSWACSIHTILTHLVPALACGNCVIIKPSSLAPLCVHVLAKCIKEAGIPKGVVNIVYGKGDVIGRALVEHTNVNGVAFVGSEKTASSICSESATHLKRLSFELGNCHPMIVCDDADLNYVVPAVIRARSVESISHINLDGNVQSHTVNTCLYQMGPLISKEHHQMVLSCIQGAINDGATLLYGGKVPKLDSKLEKGYFLEPTILGGFKNATNNQINVMEVQGPVIRIISFNTENEAAKGANSTPYGLSASIWSKDGARTHRMAKLLDAGIVWINSWLLNCPSMLQGGHKQSGNGRFGGRMSLDFYTQITTVAVPL
ncbi:2-aminomuconic semialdehyde dehydrogenase-like [Actinia tenebrosa]|uniref:2-aminomuconic semialdehyde dehydrogenase-like n=1 Tax=Actinia tenebrosa TaxID=6105 RepID=A0A6P8IC17_ACTTE|nr:2-aminomuconic semialdehyde dehydrogenase-like [Actinia tenebrosa]